MPFALHVHTSLSGQTSVNAHYDGRDLIKWPKIQSNSSSSSSGSINGDSNGNAPFWFDDFSKQFLMLTNTATNAKESIEKPRIIVIS